MNNRFAQSAQGILRKARRSAEKFGHTYIGSEHLLLGILQEKDALASRFLTGKGITEEKAREEILRLNGAGAADGSTLQSMTPKLKKILERAAEICEKQNAPRIQPEHLLLGLLAESDGGGARILQNCGFSPSALKNEFSAEIYRSDQAIKTKEPTLTALSTFGRDLTAMAAAGKLDPVIGREAETNRLIRALCRRQKNNPCLVGDPGVGKTAVVEGLALRISQANVPEPLLGKSILSLDLPSMIAGAKYRGEFEDRLRKVMKELEDRQDRILFIDEIHTIVGAGAAEGSLDAANILKPLLSRGGISVIGATTPEEYRRFIEKDRALERRFQPILIEEPSEEVALTVLQGLRPEYERHHGVSITDKALECAVRLSQKYLWDRHLPDKAIDLLDEAAAELRLRSQTPPPHLLELESALLSLEKSKEEAILAQDFEQAAILRDASKNASISSIKARQEWRSACKRPVVTEEHILKLLSEISGIPLCELTQTEAEDLRSLQSKLEGRVIGQPSAAKALSSAIIRVRLGLRDGKRPMGCFLFAGPTGVGKTEMARALTEILFGKSEALFRLDMSEYMEKHSISRLIGAPPGYVGYEEGGVLTEHARRHPYSVVLFDEIEKAHPDIAGILLQIAEEGMLTDSQGRKANFQNTLILLTTNLGAEAGRSHPGFLDLKESDLQRERESALRRYFKPELLGRMDEIVYFSRLSESALRKITERFLKEIAENAAKKNLFFTFMPSVADEILRQTPLKEGARHLRGTVRRLVEDSLAVAVITDGIKRHVPYQVELKDTVLHFKEDTGHSPISAD